jgi:hypothetical protein
MARRAAARDLKQRCEVTLCFGPMEADVRLIAGRPRCGRGQPRSNLTLVGLSSSSPSRRQPTATTGKRVRGHQVALAARQDYR